MNKKDTEQIETECKQFFLKNKYSFETAASLALKIGRREEVLKEILHSLAKDDLLHSKALGEENIYFLNEMKLDRNNDNEIAIESHMVPSDVIRDIIVQCEFLTKRENDVAYLIVKGLRNGEIAETLTISEHTVKNHVSNIFSKLEVKDRFQFIKEVYEKNS